MAVEQRLNGLETAVRRQRIIIAGMILLLVGLVTIAAAPQSKYVEFNSVTTRSLFIVNDAGLPQVFLGANKYGGMLDIYNKAKEHQVGLSANKTGGQVYIGNKTGETVVDLFSDDYGNGVVGAYNRKGMGRTLKPGPR